MVPSQETTDMRAALHREEMSQVWRDQMNFSCNLLVSTKKFRALEEEIQTNPLIRKPYALPPLMQFPG